MLRVGVLAWCKQPLSYLNGYVYVSSTVGITRNSKLALLCAWEHQDQKKKERLFNYWDVDLKAISFSLLYDAILQSTNAKIKKQVKTLGKKLPDFPGWKSDVYNKDVKKQKRGGSIVFSSSVGLDRGDRIRFLKSCLDESVLQQKPSLLGDWLNQMFELFNMVNGKTGNSVLLEIPLVMELLEVDIYGGVVNL